MDKLEVQVKTTIICPRCFRDMLLMNEYRGHYECVNHGCSLYGKRFNLPKFQIEEIEKENEH